MLINLNFSAEDEDEREESQALARELGLCAEMRELLRHGQVIVPPPSTSSDAKGQVNLSARTE